jgi:hypothetical protein
VEPQLERIDALFVQGAARFTSRQGTMTLHGLADSTVYFADRPRREIGHSPSRRFSVAESKRRSQRQKRSAT